MLLRNFEKFPEIYDEKILEKAVHVPTLYQTQFKFTQFFQKIGEHCLTRSLMGAVSGAGMGCFFGMLMGSLPTAYSTNVLMNPQANQLHFKQMALGMGRRMYGMAKSFSSIAFWFGGVECMVAKMRGKNDKMNNMLAGCLTGFGMGIRGGIGGATMGCVGFALFGLLFDLVLDR